MILHHIFIFRGADIGALDKKKYTPLMVAAAWQNAASWENDALFKKLINKDRDAVEKSIFLAVRLHGSTRLSTIKVSKYRHTYGWLSRMIQRYSFVLYVQVPMRITQYCSVSVVSLFVKVSFMTCIYFLNTHQLILSTPSGRSLCSESKDQEGNALLHIAACHGLTGVIELMLEWKHEIKCDVKNAEGKTPMHLAAENGHHK